jgi:hypothetical protein
MNRLNDSYFTTGIFYVALAILFDTLVEKRRGGRQLTIQLVGRKRIFGSRLRYKSVTCSGRVQNISVKVGRDL